MNKDIPFSDVVHSLLVAVGFLLALSPHVDWHWFAGLWAYPDQDGTTGFLYAYQDFIGTIIGGGLALLGAWLAVVKPLLVEKERRNNRIKNLLTQWDITHKTLNQGLKFNTEDTEAAQEQNRKFILNYLYLLVAEFDRFEQSYKDNLVFLMEHSPEKFEKINDSIRLISNANSNAKNIYRDLSSCPADQVFHVSSGVHEIRLFLGGYAYLIKEAFG